MIYFIFWVLLIVAVIASVPVASWLDNKKRRALAGPQEPADNADESADEALAEEETPAEFGDEVADAEAEPVEVAGGDDFSAFDDEFK